jgi:tRNA 2-thiouridine synthesizing protein A
MAHVAADRVLDTRGLLCPMPVVKAGKEMKALPVGQVLKVLVTDRGAVADFPAWAEDAGHQLVEWHEEGDGSLVFFVRKGEEG